MNRRSNKKYLIKYDSIRAGTIDGQGTFLNDKACLKAKRASYKLKGFKKPTSTPLTTLFVSRLSKDTIEKDLLKSFDRYGHIIKAEVVRNFVTGTSKQYGFIEFEKERDCSKAYKDGNGLLVRGFKILVDYERGRSMEDWKPRRIGGGLGGKKNSGQLRFGGRDRPFLPARDNKLVTKDNKLGDYSDQWRWSLEDTHSSNKVTSKSLYSRR